jgi:hypothetical protein
MYYTTATKLHNALPSDIKTLNNNMNIIKLPLEDYFLAHSFYIAEFFQIKVHKPRANY